jgi:hypothetical protein
MLLNCIECCEDLLINVVHIVGIVCSIVVDRRQIVVEDLSIRLLNLAGLMTYLDLFIKFQLFMPTIYIR